MEKKEIKSEVEIPTGVTVEVDQDTVSVKGEKGSVSKKLFNPRIAIAVQNNGVVIKALRLSKREKKLVNSFAAHLRNMIKGVKEPYKYVLKVCSGHFPMTVSINGDEFSIKNFLGEKAPRILKLKQDVSVKVEGDRLLVESVSKELASQTAADIEQLTRRTKYDTRIFQDGIYITIKDGKELK